MAKKDSIIKTVVEKEITKVTNSIKRQEAIEKELQKFTGYIGTHSRTDRSWNSYS